MKITIVIIVHTHDGMQLPNAVYAEFTSFALNFQGNQWSLNAFNLTQELKVMLPPIKNH